VSASKLGLLSLVPPTYGVGVVIVLLSSTTPLPGWIIGVHVGVIAFAAAIISLSLNRVRTDASLHEAEKKRWTSALLWVGLFAAPAYLLTHHCSPSPHHDSRRPGS
jgi:hypothetical protein